MNSSEENQEQNLPLNKGKLGKPAKRESSTPLDNFQLSEEALKKRQQSIGQTRKYFGPISESEKDKNELFNKNQQDVDKTDCEEPSVDK